VIVECSHCGAPLDVPSSKRTCRCNYCGRTNVVRSLRTLSMQTPPDWSPPKTWVPPAHVAAEGALEYTVVGWSTVAGGAGLLVLVVVCLTCVLPLGITLAFWFLDPANEGRPIIEGPGFTRPWPDGPPPMDRD